MDEDKPQRTRAASKVPSGRVSRMLQIGATAARMAAGGAVETARRARQRLLAETEGLQLPHVLLTADNARLLASRLARLRGAAMKVGQMLSLEGDNMLPPEFAAALEMLRSSAHQMPDSQVREVLVRELGAGFLQKFGSFSFVPLAAASIGQVHRATTLDGRPIVVKIQYPGVAESVDSDVDNLRSLLTLARLLPGEIDVAALTAEVKEELHREVDYARELAQLELYRASLSDQPEYLVPSGHQALSTSRVLSMDYAPGQELLVWSRTASQEDRNDVAEKLLSLLCVELFVTGLMQTDPNPANYLYDSASKRLVLLDFGATREVPARLRELYRRAFVGLATRDRELIRGVLTELGVEPTSGSPALAILLSLSLEASDAFQPGIYDFAASDLAQRLKARGAELVRYQRDLKSPPPEIIFFQRKLGGTFLLCRQLGAQIDCHAVMVRHGIL